jgi:thiamine biosynthesis lipoprotein
LSAEIHVFTRHAMATFFQARIAGEDASYAAQAARTAFDVVDHLESLLTRFRENSEICQMALLAPGESMRLSEPTFACLEIAARMELATDRAFCISPLALQQDPELPKWSLVPSEMSIRCEAGRLDFDLGAIGKGFALDRMAEELRDWECRAVLLVAGGSSILAGDSPGDAPGWSSGLGEDDAEYRIWLANGSLSGSGLAVKGQHIVDPRTGRPIESRSRVWALADTAAESDALSTAGMVLTAAEIEKLSASWTGWRLMLQEGNEWKHYGARPLPPRDGSVSAS